jgi:hypothetical protein
MFVPSVTCSVPPVLVPLVNDTIAEANLTSLRSNSSELATLPVPVKPMTWPLKVAAWSIASVPVEAMKVVAAESVPVISAVAPAPIVTGPWLICSMVLGAA